MVSPRNALHVVVHSSLDNMFSLHITVDAYRKEARKEIESESHHHRLHFSCSVTHHDMMVLRNMRKEFLFAQPSGQVQYLDVYYPCNVSTVILPPILTG